MGLNKVVDFSKAKLLKEKGFDEYCFFIWNEENLEEPYYYAENYQMICLRIHYYGDIPMVNNSYIEKYATYVEKDEIREEVYELLTAPTIAEVVMWLYEKHGIWVQGPFPLNNGKWEWVVFFLKEPLYGSDGFKNRMSIVDEKPYYNTPTEAYEAAIEYTLKNLI